LDALGVKYNRLLYNRHPMITPNRLSKRLLFRRSWHADNSFHLDDQAAVDYMVIAGSPEWRIGGRMEALFRFVIGNRVPCAFLAVGAGSGGAFNVDGRDHRLLRAVLDSSCELVTVRDKAAESALSGYDPHLLPCTALFASRTQRLRIAPGVVGLVFQNCTQRFNSVTPATYEYLLFQYRRIMAQYPCVLICHTCADFIAARRAFPDADTRYSALAEDYEAIFDACDIVVGPRVHGSGLAASLGIPNVLLQHCARGLTGWGFLSVTARPGDDLLALVDRIEVKSHSERLLEWKRSWLERTVDLVRERTSLCAE
jgi:hypothetical protein